MIGNPVAIMHTYLIAQAALMALVTGCWSPRLPDRVTVAGRTFVVRGLGALPPHPLIPRNIY